jgi:phosphatidylglycerol:prolipoprotein diacylglycerol transferase
MFYLSYQICGALLWLIAVYLALRGARLNRVFGIDLAFVILVSGLAGGRLFHVIYENPEIYFRDPLKILKIWEGGFVLYGGFFLSAMTSIFFCYLKKESFFKWADFFAPFLAAGYVWGRFGCFLAGCCFGLECDLPWAIEQRHPTQIYAMITELIVFFFLLSEGKQTRPVGVIFSSWLIGHAVGRLFMEPYRDDFRGSPIFGLSISQFLSLVLLGVGVFLLVWRLQLKQKPDS